MKLRQKSKRDQALDAVASIAKTWSEWRLGEKVTKTAAKGAKKATKTAQAAKKKQSSSGTTKRKPLKVAAVLALVGGIGAAVAKKITGGKAEPLYTPPRPAPDMAEPPPSPVAVEDLAGAPPDAGAADVPAAPLEGDSSADVAPEPEDLISDTASEPEADKDAGETTVDAGGASDDAPTDRPL